MIMEKLTIEQKAKAYDEAIAYAKMMLKIIGNATVGNLLLKNEFQRMFPELAESEDGRIRENIINIIKDVMVGNVTPLPLSIYKESIAWLEKQGEQKPAENSLREKILSNSKTKKQVVLISESSGQAEIDWDTRSVEDTKKLLECGLSFINKQLGVKPTEWSEKDNKIKKRILDLLNANDSILFEEYQEIANWLEGLRPQNKWKPTEQQLKSLRWVAEYGDILPRLKT